MKTLKRLHTRLIAMMLAVCIVLGLLPGSALAANTRPTSGTCGDGLTWTYEPKLSTSGIDEGGLLTISGNGAMDDYITDISPWGWSYNITQIIIENGVTTIGNGAFGSQMELISVTIPDSVTSIGAYAFHICPNLASIHIPDSVTAIGDYAFFGCSSLSSISIPQQIVSIGNFAFNGCMNLQSINFPDGLRMIGNDAFSGTGLTKVSIPASAVRIDRAFDSCENLVEISVSSDNKYYSSYDGLLLNKSGTQLKLCPDGKTSCKMPYGITSIANDAFNSCSKLVSVEFPNSVTNIGTYAFSYCTSLKNVIFPDSITQIEQSAFTGCTTLTSITIPGSITNIEWNSFSDCTKLTDITISEGINCIFGDAFSNCSNLTSISFPASLSEIEPDAFAHCVNLKTISYAGTEAQWKAIEKDGNQELDLAKITFNSTSTPIPPIDPDTPTTPGNLTLTKSAGGLGTKVTTQVTSGHWLTVQVSRAGAISITAIQAPGSGGIVSVSFSAPAGSAVQVWETQNELTFTDGVPNGVILNKGTIDL